MKPGDRFSCTFEFDLNLAGGTFYLGVELFRFNNEELLHVYYPAANDFRKHALRRSRSRESASESHRVRIVAARRADEGSRQAMSDRNTRPLNLRVGDLVEVRSEKEILATLDEQGAIDGMPFMPEMLDFCGKRFRVGKRADKTCNTITVMESRRIYDTVHLEDVRCTGAAHGGCQAQCMIYWKEAWLRRVESGGTNPQPSRQRACCLGAAAMRPGPPHPAHVAPGSSQHFGNLLSLPGHRYPEGLRATPCDRHVVNTFAT